MTKTRRATGAALPCTERFVEINGLRTFYRSVGEGTDVVLVHGAGVSSRYWRPAQRRLAEAGFRVHALDLPGFGRSANPPWPPEFERLSQHLEDWIDHVIGGPFHLVGQSVGCELATMAAVRRTGQVQSLVLAAPAGLPTLSSLWGQCMRAACDSVRERLILYPAIIPDYVRCGPIRVWRILWEQRRTRVDRLLPQISQPTLIVRGARDVVVSQRRVLDVARMIGGAQVAIVPGAHGAHFTHADEFAQTLSRFLHQVGIQDLPVECWDDIPGRLPPGKGPISAGMIPQPGG